MITPKLRQQIFQEYPICFYCGMRQSSEVHHAIIPRQKGNGKLDVIENLIGVCQACHQIRRGKMHNFEFRQKVWHDKRMRGYDMNKWYEGLNLRVKDNYGG